MTLDDIAERVQAIIDNPALGDDEHNDMILQAIRARLDGDEFTRPAGRDDERPRRKPSSRATTPDRKHRPTNIAGMSRGKDDAGEQAQERGDEVEDEPTLEQGGGGLERSAMSRAGQRQPRPGEKNSLAAAA